MTDEQIPDDHRVRRPTKSDEGSKPVAASAPQTSVVLGILVASIPIPGPATTGRTTTCTTNRMELVIARPQPTEHTVDKVGARERLMDAALRLVALHGQEGASSRAITRAAGQRHNSAVSYHFGTRQELFRAVWFREGDIVHQGRQQLIVRRGSTDWSLVDLVDVYITPLAAYLDSRQPSYWARFNVEALNGYPVLVTPQLRDQVDLYVDAQPIDTLTGLLEQMQRLIGTTSQPDAALRVSIMVRAVFSTFAAWERDAQQDRATLTASELGESLRTTSLSILQASTR